MQEDLISFAESSCSIFWSHLVMENRLPGSVTGKLGGPSQRRLSSPMTTSVLQAVLFLCFCTIWCINLCGALTCRLASHAAPYSIHVFLSWIVWPWTLNLYIAWILLFFFTLVNQAIMISVCLPLHVVEYTEFCNLLANGSVRPKIVLWMRLMKKVHAIY